MTKQLAQEKDYFTDHSILKDPYAWFEAVHAKGPVYQPADRDLLIVTGFDEVLEVLGNAADFSSWAGGQSPLGPLPFEPKGDDISAQIEAYRAQFPAADTLVSLDDLRHAKSRSLLSRLFTPSRLKANEDFMRGYADKLVTTVVANKKCELINEIANPYATLVIADLLGVPDDDRDLFRKAVDGTPPPGNLDNEERPTNLNSLQYMASFFVRYVQDRRANPRTDILTDLATAKYPDGSMPDFMEIVGLATLLFAAGQHTTAKLLGSCVRVIAETPELQRKLRENRELLPSFVEEMLRLEGSIKVTFRVTRKKTKIGTTEVPAGKRIVVAVSAANRDPRRWDSPKELKLDRARIKEHAAFGRGPHTCIGAPLARAEVRIILDRFLEHTSDISLSEAEHGKPGNVKLDYEPSFLIRGLTKLHVELKPS